MMLDQPTSVRRSFHAPAQSADPSAPAHHHRPISFGPFRLDPAQRTLTEGDKILPLGGRAFDVLMALVERRGSIVSKNELMECVWPGRIVEENTLQAQISLLRRACMSNRDLIKTVAGRGYQFTGEIEETDDIAGRPGGASSCRGVRERHANQPAGPGVGIVRPRARDH